MQLQNKKGFVLGGGGDQGRITRYKEDIYTVEYHKLGYYLNLSESKKKGSYEFSY